MKLETSPEEQELISAIAQRSVDLDIITPENYQDMEMDITACHCNGCPLKLAELVTADDFTFTHDVVGIRRNLDRRTGKILGHFLPRLVKREG